LFGNSNRERRGWHILLHQRNKIEDILSAYDMKDAKPVATPMEISYLSSISEESDVLPNNTLYRQAVGSLLYVATVSRPDIAAAFGISYHCVSQLREPEWKAVKQMMKYLFGTHDTKLRLSTKEKPVLKCYMDADWGGEKKN
jgi:hypothetical protein